MMYVVWLRVRPGCWAMDLAFDTESAALARGAFLGCEYRITETRVLV